MSRDRLLEVRGLDAGYADLQILYGVDLRVDDAEYVTIVGPNGAGKSTLMKSVFGLTTVMGGELEFRGRSLVGSPPEEIIHFGVGYVPQSDNVFPGLTVRENLEMGAYILEEFPKARLAAIYERFPVLEERSAGGNSRCSRWAGPSCSTPISSCSTSPAPGWPPTSSPTCSTASTASIGPGPRC